MTSPQLILVERGSVWWHECRKCGEEVSADTGENGVLNECGSCGQQWWEGEPLLSKNGGPNG